MANAVTVESRDTNGLSAESVSESRKRQNRQTRINSKQPRHFKTKTLNRSTTPISYGKYAGRWDTPHVIATSRTQPRQPTGTSHMRNNQLMKTSSSGTTFGKQTTEPTQQTKCPTRTPQITRQTMLRRRSDRRRGTSKKLL